MRFRGRGQLQLVLALLMEVSAAGRQIDVGNTALALQLMNEFADAGHELTSVGEIPERANLGLLGGEQELFGGASRPDHLGTR